MLWPFVTRGRYDDLRERLKEVKEERDRLLHLFNPALGTAVPAPPDAAEREEEESEPETTEQDMAGKVADFNNFRRPSIAARRITRERSKAYHNQSGTEAVARIFNRAREDAVMVIAARAAEDEAARKEAEQQAAQLPQPPAEPAPEAAAEEVAVG